MQYKLLITIDDSDKCKYCVNNGWTGRKLERQINCLLLNNDKEAVLAVARNERISKSPKESIKDPMILDFLGLERKPTYYEKDPESAIISHIADSCSNLAKDSHS